MAPKGKKGGKGPEPTHPPISEEEIDESFDVSSNGLNVGSDILSFILSRVNNAIEQQYVNRKSMEVTTKECLVGMITAINTNSIVHDSNERYQDCGSWECEEEPAPCTVDKWARGIIPVKRRMKDLNVIATGSLSGGKAARSVHIANKWDVSSIGSKQSKSRSAVRKSSFTASSANLLGNTNNGKKDANDGPKPVPITREPSIRVDSRVERLRKKELNLIEKKAKEAKRKKDAEEKRKAEEEKLRKLKADLKGKKYTFDKEGNLIVISAPNPNKLPSFRYVFILCCCCCCEVVDDCYIVFCFLFLSCSASLFPHSLSSLPLSRSPFLFLPFSRSISHLAHTPSL